MAVEIRYLKFFDVQRQQTDSTCSQIQPAFLSSQPQSRIYLIRLLRLLTADEIRSAEKRGTNFMLPQVRLQCRQYSHQPIAITH